MFSILTDPLLSLIYPQGCGFCGKLVERSADGTSCRSCWQSTRVFTGNEPVCIKCGFPLNGASPGQSSSCKHCDEHYYDSACSAGVYERALSSAVLSLKQTPYVPATAKTHLIAAFDRMEKPDGLIVIPVPLSKRRLLERGFNQAAVLAKVISAHSGSHLDEFSLIRNRDTPMHRAAMDRKAREATVKNVFEVTRKNLIEGRNIMLIDDLMTSGSTVSHCARTLKANGAEKVLVLTLARAV